MCDCLESNKSDHWVEKCRVWPGHLVGKEELSYFQDSWGWLFIILLLKIELSFEITFDRSPGHFAWESGGIGFLAYRCFFFPSRGRGRYHSAGLKENGGEEEVRVNQFRR